MARSVQNYYIKQAINCAKSFNSTSGTEGSTDSEMSPGVGQYTKSFTIPYDQRHSKNIRNAEHPVPNTRHTFGDEKVEDRFFGRSLSRSGSINGSDGGCSPGVGQYTKALVIPYFQRHSVVHSRSKSPIHYQRHTWGSEKYDSFINSHNINEDGDHHVEYVDSSTHHSDQLLPGSQQCVDSYSSNFSVASNSTKNYSQLGEYHCRHLSPSSNSSCSRGTSRERGRERNRGDQTGNSPRTPREHQFRRLIKIINEIGPVGSN